MIDSEEVTKIFMDCLFKDDEIENGLPKCGSYELANGVVHKIGFHPDRVKSYTTRIGEIINELPSEFITGGGWTFLNLPTDKNGDLWTSFQKVADQLLCLAIATKQGRIMKDIPSDLLPGGVPYVVFKVGGFDDTVSEVQPVPVKEPAVQTVQA